ncbi:MAG: glycoside hydrolase family 5 protein [Clostridia bacterium]|nr:glycoside hydrolase family 5 protein [Clostridia bacterium]
MKKRSICVLLILALLMSMVGCSAGGRAKSGGDDAIEFVKQLKIGWNLGNSLDASGTGHRSETAWGNPETTEDMILDIKAMGFNTVRIPVSWWTHLDMEGKVDARWMARVQEVVDYAYKNGMFVIVNSHHDTDYYDIGACVESDETKERNIARMTKLWAQIAENFKDYDEHLIFETLNEPRDVGSAQEWNGGTAEEREVIYEMNREIVKTIRKTGGSNKDRYIMVPCYGATSNLNILKEMKLPEDDRIILSVHAYSPYHFAMDASGPAEFTDSDRRELDAFFGGLNELFVSRGVPVILGEFGVTNKDNREDRLAWADYYVRGAKQYSICCIVWDNNVNGVGGECFGLYDRRGGEWFHPDLAQAYVEAAG